MAASAQGPAAPLSAEQAKGEGGRGGPWAGRRD